MIRKPFKAKRNQQGMLISPNKAQLYPPYYINIKQVNVVTSCGQKVTASSSRAVSFFYEIYPKADKIGFRNRRA